eukprot:1796291-Amphidinium_carterae.2
MLHVGEILRESDSKPQGRSVVAGDTQKLCLHGRIASEAIDVCGGDHCLRHGNLIPLSSFLHTELLAHCPLSSERDSAVMTSLIWVSTATVMNS